MRTDPTARPLTGFLLAVALLATVSPAAAQQVTQLTAVSSASPSVSAGGALQLRVRLEAVGIPIDNQPIDWRVVSSDAGAYGPSMSYTNSNGVAVARFHFPQSGTTAIEASFATLPPVRFTVVSTPAAPGPGPSSQLLLAAVGATDRSLVLGDRDDLAVVVTYAGGRPAAGVGVRFAVESSPGSPGVGRSDQTVLTDDTGVASASYGFSTAGRVEIRASIPGAQDNVTPDSILFTLEVASLGALTPERNTYRTAGEALDQVCRDVFVDGQGNQRAEPLPTPLCVYMTGTLEDRTQRADAVRALTNTGLGSQSTTALAGIEQQTGSIQSRLAALRGGGLRGAAGQIALQIDGVGISNGTLSSAREAGARHELFSSRLDRSFARLYAGLDAGAQESPGAGDDATGDAPEVAPRRERPWGFFVTGRLTRGHRVDGTEETGFDFDTKGATLGFDHAVGANGFLGFALSGLRNTTDLRGGGGSLDGDSLAVTLYAIHEGEKGYAQLTATYGQTSFDQHRSVALPVVGPLEARARFDGDQLASTVEVGRSLDGRAGSLTCFGRGSWARASIDGFRETGAVATIPGSGFGPVDFGLEVAQQRLDSLLGEAGLDWGKAISVAHGLVIPQLTVTWSHEFDHDAQQVRARFLGDTAAGSSFFVFTDPPDRDWLTASAALRFQFLWGSLFVAYDHEFQRADLETQTYNAGLRFEF